MHERHPIRLDGVELDRDMARRYALHHEARRNLVIDRVGSRHKRGAYRDCSVGRGFHVQIGTVRTMLVP